MKIGYADPPYHGHSGLYRDHPDYAGEVDHAELIGRLEFGYDGWILHASATPLSMALLAPLVLPTGARWCAWVKGFAAFKKNVSVAYAWEPVIVKAARKPVVSKRHVSRDWIQESITLRRGLTGAKPEAVCHWAFEVVGARPEDEMDESISRQRGGRQGVEDVARQVYAADGSRIANLKFEKFLRGN